MSLTHDDSLREGSWKSRRYQNKLLLLSAGNLRPRTTNLCTVVYITHTSIPNWMVWKAWEDRQAANTLRSIVWQTRTPTNRYKHIEGPRNIANNLTTWYPLSDVTDTNNKQPLAYPVPHGPLPPTLCPSIFQRRAGNHAQRCCSYVYPSTDKHRRRTKTRTA